MQVDFLLIGGGVSGISLQMHLEREGATTLILDKGVNHSSHVAAGIVNPIAGKFFTLTWRAEEFFPYAKEFYSKIGKEAELPVYQNLPVYRIFSSAGEQNIWLGKAHQAKYQKHCLFQHEIPKGFKGEFGALQIKNAAMVKVPNFFNSVKKHAKTRIENVDITQIDLEKGRYKDINFKKVVFCDGYHGIHNPLMPSVPLIANKGELMEIEVQHELEYALIMAGVFIQPLEQNRYRIGATYQPNDTSLEPTSKQKTELCRRLENVLDADYTIVRHYAGIRPSTKDRRPFVGRHPEHKNVYFFTGMGSKAYSIAPLLANELTQHLINNAPLHPESNIERFC